MKNMKYFDTKNNHPIRLLAPMEGLTDPLMRKILTQIANDLGRPYDWSVSEFIRVTHHVLPEQVFYKFVPELHNNSRTASGTPIHIQLLGSDPILMAQNAVKACQLGALAIDLNFGCPAKTVNNHRGGSVLLNDPALMQKIISQVRKQVPSHIGVSVKIRLGYENWDNMNDIRQAIADSGANWLTIHARTKSQGYKPPAYWDKIAHFTDLPMPVIANGDIWTASDAKSCMTQAKTCHLMLGRGAVTRPDLIACVDNPSHPFTLSWAALLPYQLAFLTDDSKNEKGLIGRYKQWLGMLTKGYNEAVQLWQHIRRLSDKESIIKVLEHSQKC